jgi:hypothetical protein
MSVSTIENQFREKLSGHIRLHAEGRRRYRVFTPFRFSDGDHLAIVMKQENGHWVLTDEGHTYMHLTYSMDERSLQQGTRQQIITNTLSRFDVEDVEGELRTIVHDNEYGDALYDFVQALLHISDVTYLSRERVRSTFKEDFRTYLEEQIPAERRQFNWKHPEFDPEGSYPVDCYVNGLSRPLLIFGLANDSQTRDATITLHQFERWGFNFHSLTIFEDQEQINRKVLARFSDVSDKQYSNLPGNRPRIGRYLQQYLSAARA